MIDVIILAAGSIKDKIHFSNFIFESPALIPINVRSSISYILDFYSQEDMNIHIVVNETDKDNLVKELNYYKNKNIVYITNSIGVVDTLGQALEIIKPKNEVIVNVVTTIPTSFPSSNSVLLSNLSVINAEWSGVLIEDQKPKFIYKNENYKKMCNAFTGILRCNAESLKSAVANTHYKSDLLFVAENLNQVKALNFEYCQWIDCGHELNFYDAKAKLISSRSFNSIEIESITGVITKSSMNIKKFQDEINYIELLPRDIAIFFPSIFSDVKIENNRASVKMEYYGYSTLAEYMLYWNLQGYIWEKVFLSLEIVFNSFKKYTYSIGKKAFTDFYLKKTFERVEEFKKQLFKVEHLFQDEISINGNIYKSIDLLKTEIETKIEELYNENDFYIMHGDLCFNNILYDIKTGIIRLIDARGSFGDNCIGIYGDMKYDVAKLSHSVLGGYDFLVNNLFSLEYSENIYNYAINKRENFETIQLHMKKLIKNLGYEEKDILFLVGLLFVSMCPLHSDDKERQIVMYLHGLKYLNESLEIK